MEKMCEKKKSLQDFYELKVKDIMQAPKSTLQCIDEKADVETVISHLAHTDHVWVMDCSEPSQLVGVITQSDTIALLSPPITSLESFDKPDSHSLQFGENLLAEEIMSKKPVTTSPNEILKDVLLKMKEQKIKQLPVIDENQRLIGEVSLSHLIQQYSKQHTDVVREAD